MWPKYLIIFVLFYFLAVLQNSFFAHFGLFGAFPNFVFAVFFVVVFFSKKNASALEILFYAISAGLFLDFFLATYFGVSIILLLAVGFLAKWIKFMLKENTSDKFPLVYFIPLFLVGFLAYGAVVKLFLKTGFSTGFVFEIIYNLAVGVIAFYIYKKFIYSENSNHQLKLFK